MATTVTMPQLGETVTEGTILKWAKEVGDTIAEDEVLVEISTDKVDTEVPSPAAGDDSRDFGGRGRHCGCGHPIGRYRRCWRGVRRRSCRSSDRGSRSSDRGSRSSDRGSRSSDRGDAGGSIAGGGEGGFRNARTNQAFHHRGGGLLCRTGRHRVQAASSLASGAKTDPRKRESTYSLLTGTGQGGRITRKDVDAFLVSTPAVSKPAPAAAPAPAMPAPAAAATAPAPAAQEGAPPETIELDRMRIRIAENMIKAKQGAAHVWTSVEVDFERIERVRQARKVQFKASEGFSLTYLPFISRATIDALKAFPVVNSSFNLEEKTATFHKKVDLGIAIDLNQRGLVVARVRNADGLRLVGIARQVRELAEKGPGRKTEPRRPDRLDFHDHQPRTVRLVHVGADHQHSQRCDPLN